MCVNAWQCVMGDDGIMKSIMIIMERAGGQGR